MAKQLDFRNKNILAPMVRVCHLPTRLLSLDYGADIVYSEETIDYKMLQSTRIENKMLGTVDFVWTNGSVIFRTHPRERDKLVFQIGTADAQRALKVARLVEKDVSAIDVNMGCPKEFSIKGGMGAALLTQPDKVKEIVTTLVNGISIPVSCKIRLLDTTEATIELVKLIQSAGAVAVTIHGRTRDERPGNDNHNDIIKVIAQSVTIPVIANGDSQSIKRFEDLAKFRTEAGASSVMVARSALYNPSIFHDKGLVNIEEVAVKYLKYAIDFDLIVQHCKYVMQSFMHSGLETPRGRAMQGSATVRGICALWDLDGYYDEVFKDRVKTLLLNGDSQVKKRKLDDGSEIQEMEFKFVRKSYSDRWTPKLLLYEYCMKNKFLKPQYNTAHNIVDKTFHSIVTVADKQYSSSLWDKSKKFTEQAAASVCLQILGLPDGRHDNSAIGNSMNKIKTDVCDGAIECEVLDEHEEEIS